MIRKELVEPQSIVVIGASNDLKKPGGKLLYNLRNGSYKGALYAMNPREDQIQGIPAFKSSEDLPNTDLAILAIPASLCVDIVEYLSKHKRNLQLKKESKMGNIHPVMFENMGISKP